jgi:hypothetical protein
VNSEKKRKITKFTGKKKIREITISEMPSRKKQSIIKVI